eukprot:6534258-Pyramimonas_sp.AAC.1
MSVLVDMYKCYECRIVSMLVEEARLLEYPLRLIWMGRPGVRVARQGGHHLPGGTRGVLSC